MKYLAILVAMLLVVSCKTMSPAEYRAMNEKAAEADRLSKENEELVRQLEELQTAYESMETSLKEEIEQQQVKLEKLSDRSVLLTMQENVVFSVASIKINRAGRRVLAKVAKSLKEAPDSKIRVVGHTDILPITNPDLKKRFIDNWELSAARAAAVARVFVWGYDIPEERITVVGRSHVEPVASNTTAKGRSKNRRIEVYLEQ